jgi:hypothetical protein
MSATIGRVSETLRKLLEAQMSPAMKVTLLSPGDPSPLNVRVNLFLYRITRNAQLENLDWAPKPGVPGRLVFPPLALNLFYLLTVFATLDPQTGLADAHGIMGEAMRVLHENAIVPEAFLVGGLAPGQIKVTLVSADIEELSKIWTALTKEFRLSAVYEISYVDIPSTTETAVPPRVVKPSVSAGSTSQFPSVGSMQPVSGKVGTVLTFSGENLANWKVTVKMGNQVALQDVVITDSSSFTAAIPAALLPGIYEVVVDVAGISGFESSVEVTL